MALPISSFDGASRCNRAVHAFPGVTTALAPAVSPRSTPRRITKRGADTRDRILAATIRCIVRHGFAATTIESVMAEADISRGSVLHQFPTRLDLAIATAERSMRTVMDEARAMAAGIDDPFARMADYAQIVWDTHSMPEGLALADILQSARWDAELAAGIAPIAAIVEAEVADELVALATAAGVADPAVLVPRGWMLIASARGLIIERGVDGNRPMINAAIEEMKRSHRRYCETLVPARRSL